MNPPASLRAQVKSRLAKNLLEPLLNFFSQERPTGQILLITLILSVIYTLHLFSLDFLLGKSSHWSNLVGDHATPWVGYQYFIRDTWRFPLFYTVKLGMPEGANIIFTDSIPLLALLGKVIYKIFNVELNFYGVWIGSCYVLQGLFMAALLRAMGHRSLAVVSGALLALTLPAFLFRIGHPALLGHFLILAGLTLYIEIYNSPRITRLLVSFAFLLAITLLVHPYLFVMNLGIFTAAIAQKLYSRELSRSKAASCFTAVLLAMLGLMIASGHVDPYAPRKFLHGEYGMYGLNLLSPVFPLESSLFPGLTNHAWKGKGFTAEGYNYLGFGVLLLLTLHLLVSRQQIIAAFRQHRALKWMLLLFTMFALTNQVYFHHELLFSYPLSKRLAAIAGGLRASGRFFWPVAYVMIARLSTLTLRRFKPGIAVAILTGVLIIQWFDTEELRLKVIKNTQAPDHVRLANKADWLSLIRQHQTVKLYPSYMCGVPSGDNLAFLNVQNFNIQIQLLTAQADIPVNSAYLARQNKDCDQENQELADLQFKPHILYFFLDNATYFLQSSVAENALHHTIDSSQYCHRFYFGHYCTIAGIE